MECWKKIEGLSIRRRDLPLSRKPTRPKEDDRSIVLEAGKVGFKVSTKKKTEDIKHVEIEGEASQEVEKIVYLGCEMRKVEDIRNEVGNRISKTGAVFRNLEKFERTLICHCVRS